MNTKAEDTLAYLTTAAFATGIPIALNVGYNLIANLYDEKAIA